MNRAGVKGFTLVELLVAVGITAVLAAVLLGLVTRTVTLWERSASALALENEAALILHHLITDLESAHPPVANLDGEPWIEVVLIGEALSELRLIVPVAGTSGEDNDPTTLREVTYRLADGALFRFERSAGETLAAGYRWATWPPESNEEFLLGERVEELSLLFLDRNRDEVISPANNTWPVLARVELVLITPDGAQRTAAAADGFSTESIEQIGAETSREFVQWVGMGGTR